MTKKPCSTEGCGKTRVAKGLCSKCYREKYGKSYKPKLHRIKDVGPFAEALDAEAKKNAKAIQESALKMTITELSNRCLELSNENFKLKSDLEIIENNYNERFNELEIEQLRTKANAWDLLFTILTTKGGRNG